MNILHIFFIFFNLKIFIEIVTTGKKNKKKNDKLFRSKSRH